MTDETWGQREVQLYRTQKNYLDFFWGGGLLTFQDFPSLPNIEYVLPVYLLVC